jgi:hypothetical protein
MADDVESQIEELKQVYGAVTTVTAPSSQTLLRFTAVPLPGGCRPNTTPALLVLKGQERPQFYVTSGIKVPNGIDPRSTGIVQVEGEAWLQFSYTFPWEWSSHTLVQFVAASLQRFAKLE